MADLVVSIMVWKDHIHKGLTSTFDVDLSPRTHESEKV